MKWKPVRNKDYYSRDTYYEGECPRFNNRKAKLFIHLTGKQECKSDLQLTFTPHIKECSLLKEKNEKDTTCMLWCPLFKEYKNSHSF